MAAPENSKIRWRSVCIGKITVIVCTILTILTQKCSALPDFPSVTYEMMYSAGLDAYSNQKWSDCMKFMSRAIEDYHFYTETLAECRRLCTKANKFNTQKPVDMQLAIFGNYVYKSNCIRKCKMTKFKTRPDNYSAEVDEAFENLKPYDYYQLCAFKIQLYQHAAAAAYTFLLSNKDNEAMQKNIHYYRSLPQVKDEFFVNLEEKPYQTHYIRAVEAYNREDWLGVIESMEKSTREYFKEHRTCRLLCEGKVEQEQQLDFIENIADYFIKVLDCKKSCGQKLDKIYGQFIEDFIAGCYHYLQFAYFKVGEFNHASECAGTYLLFKPGDETMEANKDAYLRLKGIGPMSFTPREDAQKHYDLIAFEAQLLKYIDEHYMFDITEVIDDDDEFDDLFLGDSADELDILAKKKHDLEEFERAHGFQVFAGPKELKGKKRVVVDGFLTDEQCGWLKELANIGGIKGDGYQQYSTPHTKHEMYHGITVDKAAELVEGAKINMTAAELYLNVSELMRQYTEKYLNLASPLYFHFTHLVCRTSLDDGEERTDLSHPIHADNCIMTTDGKCLKKLPAFIWRDYTGLLYLNDNFEGGEFFFADRNKSMQSSVKPKCGRLVSFQASDYHGVKAVTSGQRCALAVWFTLDRMYQETAHDTAFQLLAKLRENPDLIGQKKETEKDDSVPVGKTKALEVYDDSNVQVIATDEDLGGPQRMAADGLATEEECQELCKLANAAAVQGDGYRGKEKQSSPHTKHEIFAGLNVVHAYKGTDRALEADEMSNTGGITITEVTELVQQMKVGVKAVKLYLDVAERAKEFTARYFGLTQPLYFDFTHLVCRTALEDHKSNQNRQRKDLSHPIHADNCHIQQDGSCRKKPPAYIQRDFRYLFSHKTRFWARCLLHLPRFKSKYTKHQTA
ncbi:prolyl 3-hydroxylase 1 isoform X3 [Lingula anatina]|uniref:procollagen-proline 3-dioxygenase n=1 Tax=Lingula anatina TaxID=7574 RepID=A0A1S3I3U5_LINAN|nr:prolyl 3-hydroxylase 1 isoform X3 [Lingula anatina]|eukprot:XP_013392935.1 prolyl 3-hydroxylase 1 isoform X3 [Lingula anatina]